MPKMSQAESKELMDEWFEKESQIADKELRDRELDTREAKDGLTRQERDERAENERHIEKLQREQKEIFEELKSGHAFSL